MCTNAQRTFDGEECVGDYVEVAGRDIEMGLTWALFAAIAAFASLAPYSGPTPTDRDNHRRELAARGLSSTDSERLLKHWEEFGQKYFVSEEDGQAFADELRVSGVDPECASALLRQYLLTGERPEASSA